ALAGAVPFVEGEVSAVIGVWAGLNRERTERGVSALGMPVRGPEGPMVAAISVSVPSPRDEALGSERIRSALSSACQAGAADLAGG
ncbi:MAG: IclR family transcriptional regulator domain-containing protein, partial [Brevibacterium aurantiacum]